ncbi:MAG: tRNA glutamyl-Q(34) synthetase GluQRS, partial [Rhodobacteraceae bacterium]|nr:tRNA glutamyl-Q(34) synthetase GluQRS [Paracoccaceae bacterium]
LRIEDIDTARSRDTFEAAIYHDLKWLGLDWPMPVMRQSERQAAYASALMQLTDMGLTYPCSCSRGDIRAALSAPQEGAPIIGPDGPLYPGTCRNRSMDTRKSGDAIRLNTKAVAELLDARTLTFVETGPRHCGTHHVTAHELLTSVGDIVLARRDIATSYHLSVVVDDAAQGITHVVRGRDLFTATQVHVLLQYLLQLPTPIYHHHRLIRDEAGKRLAKRDDARALSTLRAGGATPDDIRALVGL